MVFSLLVVTDPTQACWTDPRDQDNRIDSVVHVFASDGVSAWDIHGRRRIADVEDCCKRIFGTMITEVHMLEPPELALFIDRGSQGERPLSPFRAAEIEEAWHVAERRLGLARDMSGEREASARRILRHLTGSHDSQWPSPACAEEGMEPC